MEVGLCEEVNAPGPELVTMLPNDLQQSPELIPYLSVSKCMLTRS